MVDACHYQIRFLYCIEKALAGHLEDFLVDVFVKLNMLSFLSIGLDQCLSKEGGNHNRYEDRLLYITQIIKSLSDHQEDRDLAKFYNVIKRMGTWRKMEKYLEQFIFIRSRELKNNPSDDESISLIASRPNQKKKNEKILERSKNSTLPKISTAPKKSPRKIIKQISSI